jgi:hypothetical protein
MVVLVAALFALWWASSPAEFAEPTPATPTIEQRRSSAEPISSAWAPSKAATDNDLTLSGKVIDETAQPVSRIRVEVQPLKPNGEPDFSSHEPNRGAISGPDGRFTVTQVQPGKAKVIFQQRQEGTTEERSGERVLNLTASRDDLVLQLEGSAPLDGQVTDHNGKPLPGVHVSAELVRLKGVTSTQATVWVDTGVDGRFAFVHLQPGTYELWVALKGFIAPDRAPRVATGQRDVVVVMANSPTVHGRVVTAARVPIPVFSVTHEQFQDSGGEFTLRPGKGKHLLLGFVADGFASKTLTVELKADDALELGEIILTPGRTLRGKVVAVHGGAGLEGVELSVMSSIPGEEHTRLQFIQNKATTDEHGDFQLDHIADGVAYVGAGVEGHAAKVSEVAAHQREIEIVLPPEAALYGHVRDVTGAGVKGYVEVTLNGDEIGGAEIEEDSSYLVSGLPQGHVLVSVGFHRYDPAMVRNAGFAPRPVELVAGQTAQLEFAEQPDAGKP